MISSMMNTIASEEQCYIRLMELNVPGAARLAPATLTADESEDIMDHLEEPLPESSTTSPVTSPKSKKRLERVEDDLDRYRAKIVAL